jgi:hypothetical protein
MASSRAIASRAASGGDPNLVFAGAGSAVVVLQSDAQNGNLSLFGAAPLARVDLGGMVRELALIGDDVYAAANRAGLVRLTRSGTTWNENFRFALPQNGTNDAEQAFCLAAWPYTNAEGPGVRVLVDTCDEVGGGQLYLIDPNDPSPIKDVQANLGEVWSIAVSSGFVPGKLTVLVGTACEEIKRFELDPDADQLPDLLGPTIPTWGNGYFVRDIELESQGGGTGRAFVALNRDGLAILRLDGGGLQLATGPYKPELGTPGSPVTPTVTYCNGLSYDPVGQRLAVVLGPWFRGEKQYGSEARKPIPCIPTPEVKPTEEGLLVLQVSTDAFVERAWHVDSASATGGPIGGDEVRIRAPTTTTFFADVAGGDNGAHTYQLEVIGGLWSLKRAIEDLDQDFLVSLVNTDEVLVQDDTLYAANEFSLTAFDRSLSPLPSLLIPDSVLPAEPVNTLAGFPAPGARIYSRGHDGVTIFNSDGPQRLSPLLGAALLPSGGDRGLTVRTTYGNPKIIGLDGVIYPRWLLRPNLGESDLGNATGSIELYDVGLAVTGNDPAIQRRASWVHRGEFPVGVQLPNASLSDVAVRPATATVQYWYVSYGPKRPSTEAGTTYAGNDHMGLLTLKAITIFPSNRVSLELVSRTNITLAPPEDWPWRVTYDAARQRIYVALASEGIACFDASSPGNPVLLWHRQFVPSTEISTCYQVIPGPLDSLVASYLDRGLLVIEDFDDSNSPAKFYSTRFQAIGVTADPADSTGASFFVGDGRGGLVRVTLP